MMPTRPRSLRFARTRKVLGRDPDELDDDVEPSAADIVSLRRFLEQEVLRSREGARKERLARYEVHLDRKLELCCFVSKSYAQRASRADPLGKPRG